MSKSINSGSRQPRSGGTLVLPVQQLRPGFRAYDAIGRETPATLDADDHAFSLLTKDAIYAEVRSTRLDRVTARDKQTLHGPDVVARGALPKGRKVLHDVLRPSWWYRWRRRRWLPRHSSELVDRVAGVVGVAKACACPVSSVGARDPVSGLPQGVKRRCRLRTSISGEPASACRLKELVEVR